MAYTVTGKDAGSAQNNEGIRSYVQPYKVHVDTEAEAENPFAIGSASGLPLVGEQYPYDSYATCTKLQVECTTYFTDWRVTAHYDTKIINLDSGGSPQARTNPLNERAYFDWSGEQFQRPAVVDRDGNAIGNSAGDPFDPFPMRDDSRLVVRVEKNVATVPLWIEDYQDAVNSAPFTVDGYPVAVGQAKFQRLQMPREQIRNSTIFRQLRFEIHFRKDGWNLKPLNAGFRDKDGNNILLPDGTHPTAPVPLTLGGDMLDPPSLDNATYGDFEVYEMRDFNNLPLT